VGISASPQVTGTNTPSVDPASLALVTDIGHGCVSVGSATGTVQVQLDFAGPGEVVLSPEGGGNLTVQLALLGQPGVASVATSTFGLSPAPPTYLEVTASGVTTLLTLPVGVTMICGLGGS
jgi:hypothetical protein